MFFDNSITSTTVNNILMSSEFIINMNVPSSLDLAISSFLISEGNDIPNIMLNNFGFMLDFIGERERLNIDGLFYEVLFFLDLNWNFDYNFEFLSNNFKFIAQNVQGVENSMFLYNKKDLQEQSFFILNNNIIYSIFHEYWVFIDNKSNISSNYNIYIDNFINYYFNLNFINKKEIINYLFDQGFCDSHVVTDMYQYDSWGDIGFKNIRSSKINPLNLTTDTFQAILYDQLANINYFSTKIELNSIGNTINLNYDLNNLNEYLNLYLNLYLFFFFLILIWFLLTIFFQIKMTRFNVNLSVLFIIFILLVFLNLNINISFNEFNLIFLNINFWTSIFIFVFLTCLLIQYNIFYNNEPKNFEYIFFSICFLLISFFFFLINNLIDLLILLEVIALLGYFFVGLEKTRKVVSLIGIKYLIIGILSGVFIIQSFVFLYSEFSFLDIDNFNFIYLWNDFIINNFFDFNQYIFKDLLFEKNFNLSLKKMLNLTSIYDNSFINNILNIFSLFFEKYNISFINCFNDFGYVFFEEDDLNLIFSNDYFNNQLTLWEQFNMYFFRNTLPDQFYQQAFQKYTKENIFDDMLIGASFTENMVMYENLNNLFLEDSYYLNYQNFFNGDYTKKIYEDFTQNYYKFLNIDSYDYLFKDTMGIDLTYYSYIESKLNSIVDQMFILNINNVLINSFYLMDSQELLFNFDSIIENKIILLNNNIFVMNLINNLNAFNVIKNIYISNLYSNNIIIFILFLLIFGLSFKIAAAPVHFWSLIIYQYAPIISAFFLNTFVKFIVFIIFFIVFFLLFFLNYNFYSILMFILAFNCFLFGTTGAFVEKSMKRFFIFSSLSHTGFIILNLFLISALSKIFFIIYLIYYILSSILLWSILFFDTSKNNIKTKRDLLSLPIFFKNDLLFIMFYSFNIISLSGLPPFSGFYIKYNILQNIIFNSNIGFFLIVFLLIISAFNIYYYLRIVKIICFETYSLKFDFKLMDKFFIRFLIFYLISIFFLIFFNIFFDDIYYILLYFI